MESPNVQRLREAKSTSDLTSAQIVAALGDTDNAEGCRRLDRHLRGMERDPELLERLAQVLSLLSPRGEESTSPDWGSEDSSKPTSPALNLERKLKISPEAEEQVAAIVNTPFGRSQLPLSGAALGEVKSRMLEAAPYSANQAILGKGKHYTVVGKSMTCSIGVRSKRLIALEDLNRERFGLLLCFTPEDFDYVNLAEHQVVCVALYVRDLDGAPVFLPVLVFGPSAKGDQLIVIRPEYDDSIGE